MYEHHHTRPISTRRFVARVGTHFTIASAFVAVSLALGMAGYVHFENLSLTDAFLNASMLLGGMGPVDAPKTTDGKIFAGLYALYCGLVLLVTMGIMAAPLLHRLMHRFHWSEDRS